MELGARREDAVSPVIGTILLVAITVVLVAVVAAVVMGAGDIGTAKSVGITAEPFNGNVEGASGGPGVYVTVAGGKDADSLVNLTIGFRGDMDFLLDGNTENEKNMIPEPVVGKVSKMCAVEKVEGSSLPDDMIGVFTVTGHFRDGTDQVLYQKKITLQKSTGTVEPTDNGLGTLTFGGISVELGSDSMSGGSPAKEVESI